MVASQFAFVVKTPAGATPEDEDNIVVFAACESAARTIGFGALGVRSDEFDDLRVARAPEWDRHRPIDGSSTLQCADDPELFRSMGWAFAGDERCACCGLATMDEQWACCPDCERCDDCGHEEGCERSAGDDTSALADGAPPSP